MARISLNTPDLQVLVSTMNRNCTAFLEAIFGKEQLANTHMVVVNQTTEENLLKSDLPNVLVINSFEKGLAKSRNLALKNATAPICLIADDDVKYPVGFQQTVLDGFEKFPQAAVITFQVKTFEGVPYRKYRNNETKQQGIFDVLNASSIEIAFRREVVLSYSIQFNELFGLGAQFPGGIEQVFLNGTKRHGLQIAYIPKEIVQHTWYCSGKDQGTERYYFIRGALYQNMFGKRWLFWIFLQLFFNVKHGQIKFSQVAKNYLLAKKSRNLYLQTLKQ